MNDLSKNSGQLDARVYCDYAQLVRLQGLAQSFSLLPHLRALSSLTGRHHSLFRGRGLNFEELRHYQLGDDIRNIDWQVTMRTGKPHVRSYSEEKDRNVLIVVDQRANMFFSSVNVMKSVVAAEIAALAGWRVIKESDRAGFLLVTHERLGFSKSKRSQADLLPQLQRIADANCALNTSINNDDSVSFSNITRALLRLRLKANTVIIISDWSDASEQDLDNLQQLQKRNDVLGVIVSDPLEQKLPDRVGSNHWVVGDGTHQLNVGGKAALAKVNEALEQNTKTKNSKLTRLMSMKQLPLIELDTSGEHIAQFKQQIGGRS